MPYPDSEYPSILRCYDCYAYDKIAQMTDALDAIGLFVEDCTGDYSGVYEVSK